MQIQKKPQVVISDFGYAYGLDNAISETISPLMSLDVGKLIKLGLT